MLALVALMLVGLVGLGGAYWAYKKYKQKQNQEFMYQGTMGTPREGFDAKVFKNSVLTDAVVSKLVEEHQLASKWQISEGDAMQRVRDKFRVSTKEGKVTVSYQDKDKQLAKQVLEDIVRMYYERMRASGRMPVKPAPAPAAGQ